MRKNYRDTLRKLLMYPYFNAQIPFVIYKHKKEALM